MRPCRCASRKILSNSFTRSIVCMHASACSRESAGTCASAPGTTLPRSSMMRKHGMAAGTLSTCGYQKSMDVVYDDLAPTKSVLSPVGCVGCRSRAISSRRRAFSSSRSERRAVDRFRRGARASCGSRRGSDRRRRIDGGLDETGAKQGFHVNPTGLNVHCLKRVAWF